MLRTSWPKGGVSAVPASSRRRLLPQAGAPSAVNTAAAPSSTPGAITTSRKRSLTAMAFATATVSGRLSATMPPNALRGSQATAFS